MELKNITYKYVKEEEDRTKVETLLDGLNLSIAPGTTNAIVGPSGFGKTTLFNMIYRLFDPDEGSIEFDG
jgi:ABC-type multidrug transport system fused ATPase/permease subunit